LWLEQPVPARRGDNLSPHSVTTTDEKNESENLRENFFLSQMIAEIPAL
jgi:hypothetical protein